MKFQWNVWILCEFPAESGWCVCFNEAQGLCRLLCIRLCLPVARLYWGRWCCPESDLWDLALCRVQTSWLESRRLEEERQPPTFLQILRDEGSRGLPGSSAGEREREREEKKTELVIWLSSNSLWFGWISWVIILFSDNKLRQWR